MKQLKRMPKILLPLLLVIGTCLAAGDRASADPFVALGSNLAFEYASHGRSLEIRQPVSLRGGYRFDEADVFLEYTNFRVTEGVSYLTISREHQEFIVWVRRLVDESWRVTPYVGGGVGFQYDRVDTAFGRETSYDLGDPQSLAALSAGLRFIIWKNLDLQLESRLGFSANYSPNPMFGVGAAVGWNF